MRYARILSFGVVAAVACSWSAAAIQNADELVGYCQSLERGAKGAGRHNHIPSTREALTCWGYMQAMQDLVVLTFTDGTRLLGAGPAEDTTLLDLIRSYVRYARAHPKDLQGSTAVAVINALQQTYPCSQGKAGLANGAKG